MSPRVICIALLVITALLGPGAAVRAAEHDCGWSAKSLIAECKSHCVGLEYDDLSVCRGVCSRAGVNLAQNQQRYETMITKACPKLDPEDLCKSKLWLFRADYIPEGPGYSQGHRAIQEVWKSQIKARPCLINPHTCKKDCSKAKPW